ncbi:hypothetical protein TWF730_008298 [Orbilia blumenaviensis]|uniref:Uncharacterized protein n=1 Tax=Orbilia blumenaviensis TaxID=1796055 RepID=A0AAV9V482_9PEZI
MSLEHGLYSIKAKHNAYSVGRYIVEDRSLLPKRVLGLSEDAIGGRPPVWEIEKTDDDKYIMKALGSPVGILHGKLFAFLIDMDEQQPTHWVLKAHTQHGEDVYSIENASGEGWTVTDEEDSQIEISPVDGAPTQLFEVKSVTD